MSALETVFNTRPVPAPAAFEAMLSTLPTVDLAVLQDSADLQVRRDRKYILPPELISDVIDQRRADLCVLDIADQRAFGYESVYFDTPALDSYRSSAFGRRHRFKVRTRSYLDSAACVLELKLLGSRGETVKRRLAYRLGDRRQLNGIGREYLEASGLSTTIIDVLAPTLTTSYDRSTLLDSDGSRYTVDAGLDCVGQQGQRASAGASFILETKSPGVATPVDRLLWSRGHRPVSISKYCTGLAAVTPGLAANKWNRTLRNHYGWLPADGDHRSG